MKLIANELIVILACVYRIISVDIVVGEAESPLSSSEFVAISKLRPLVQKHLYKDYMKDDQYLVRFLRAKQMDVKEASEMLLKTIQWRKDNSIDDILSRKIELENELLVTLGSFDRDLRPVGVLRLGRWPSRRLVLTGKSNQVVHIVYKFMEQLSETAMGARKAEGKNITQAYFIADLSGFNNREHICLRCSSIAFATFPVYENYYPLMTYKMVAVNAPRAFETIWTLLKTVMSEATKNTFALYSLNKPDWEQVLAKDIAEDQIPVYLGGTYSGGGFTSLDTLKNKNN